MLEKSFLTSLKKESRPTAETAPTANSRRPPPAVSHPLAAGVSWTLLSRNKPSTRTETASSSSSAQSAHSQAPHDSLRKRGQTFSGTASRPPVESYRPRNPSLVPSSQEENNMSQSETVQARPRTQSTESLPEHMQHLCSRCYRHLPSLSMKRNGERKDGYCYCSGDAMNTFSGENSDFEGYQRSPSAQRDQYGLNDDVEITETQRSVSGGRTRLASQFDRDRFLSAAMMSQNMHPSVHEAHAQTQQNVGGSAQGMPQEFMYCDYFSQAPPQVDNFGNAQAAGTNFQFW